MSGAELMERRPFLLKPTAKDYLWGGSRLNDDFHMGVDISPFAEAWVCSTHPDGVCDVPAFSCTLGEMLSAHPEWLGSHSLQATGGKAALPVLVKLIDAEKDLSVQVHPDDAYAGVHENGSPGKTEMWYVLLLSLYNIFVWLFFYLINACYINIQTC